MQCYLSLQDNDIQSLEKLFNNLTKVPDIKDKVSSFIFGIAYEYSKKK